jgi:hypothetical protein
MALSACMLEAACTTDGILWPHSAPRVSTFAYSPPRCAQTWALTVRNGAKLSIYAYSPPRCAHTWTLAVRNGATSVHACVQSGQVYADADAYHAESRLNCPRLRTVCRGVRRYGRLGLADEAKVSTFAYSPARCTQVWTLRLGPGPRMFIVAYGLSKCGVVRAGKTVAPSPSSGQTCFVLQRLGFPRILG